jgi:pimeloyl-[acyl-carrier protein] methyl ester esterase
MTLRIVFVHGWGFDASFWAPLKAALSGDVDSFCVDLGFHGKPNLVLPNDGRRCVGIGHSLGVAWLLRHRRLGPLSALVSINGFARFTKAADFPFGMDPRLLRRMQVGFEKDPKTVYRDFMTLCGVSDPQVEDLKMEPLGASLIDLMEVDERAALATCEVPVLALAGDADALVSAPMSQQTFTDHKLVMKAGGGHLLAHTEPQWCANHIDAFVKDLRA